MLRLAQHVAQREQESAQQSSSPVSPAAQQPSSPVSQSGPQRSSYRGMRCRLAHTIATLGPEGRSAHLGLLFSLVQTSRIFLRLAEIATTHRPLCRAVLVG